jgi:hypothetical protein
MDKKDIGKFNIETLSNLTFELQNQSVQSNTEKQREIKQGAKKVFENSEWSIIVPETEESACYYGKGTKWCTAGNTNNQFNYYNRQGDLYILINKQDPSEKFQFHFESSQFMDVMDRQIDLGEFFGDNDEVYEFFNKTIPNLEFKLCETALENGNTESFDSFYKKDFTDKEKRILINAAFHGDNDSDGYYTVSHVLGYLDYDGMEQDFERDFLYAFEHSMGNKYDDENYDAKMFLEYLGGINNDNYNEIFRQVDFKSFDEVQKIFELVQEYPNANQLLSQYIQEKEININTDLLKTMDYLKGKFSYGNDTFASKLAEVRIIRVTDFQKGLVQIHYLPKNTKGEVSFDKSEKGVVNYKNIIKYLTLPQINFNK